MKTLVFSCVIFLSFVVVGGADATVLTFDDITIGGGINVQSYGGSNWTNISMIHKDTQLFGIINHGYKNGVVSGDYVAMNNYAQTANVVNNREPFDFNLLGIDKLVSSSSGGMSAIEKYPGGEHFMMDNFTSNESAPVPEPATMMLFGTGLISLAAFIKIFRKA